VSVTKNLAKQLGVGLGYVILIIIALAFIAAVIMWVLIPVGLVTIAVGGTILTFFRSIPIYIYIILAAILAVPMYSTFWCICRNFSDEDWKHTDTDFFTQPLAIGGGIIFAIWLGFIGLAIGSGMPYINNYGDRGDCGFVLLLIFALVGIVLGAISGGFFGNILDTYRYHRKRIADTKVNLTVETAKENL
jgi:hypothetical protein